MAFVRVKICGITNTDDALCAQSLGADMLGFIFAESPRRISPDKARKIISFLSPLVLKTGVFVNERPAVINSVIKKCALDFVQLSGDESISDIKRIKGAKVIKAVRPESEKEAVNLYGKYAKHVSLVLFDTKSGNSYGGSGKVFDWGMLGAIKGYYMAAGGITPFNAAALVRRFMPHAIDVGSGVEEFPGKKSPQKLRALFRALSVRGY